MKKLVPFTIAFTCMALFVLRVNAQSTWNGTAWSPSAPTSTTDAIIASSTAMTASFTCKNLTINSGITLTSSISFTVTVSGDITNNGNGCSGAFRLILTSNCTLYGNSFRFGGYLYLNSAGMVLTTNNKLVLYSDANATGVVYTVATGATIVGNITQERYIPSNNRKRYTLVSSPVYSPTIYDAWQEGGASTAGYGTQITGGTGTSAADGFDATSSAGTASIYTYNDNNGSGSKWVALTNTNATTLSPGKGFLVFVRGDRTIAPGATSSNTVLRATGTLETGNKDLSSQLTLGASKYSLVANPYNCAITWVAGITKTNLTGFFTAYDSDNAYFVTSDGATKSPSSGNQQAVNSLQPGQAFFVQNAASGTPGLLFTPTAKTVAPSLGVTSNVFRELTPTQELDINLYSTAEGQMVDGTVAVFGNSYQTGKDFKDASKFTNLAENFALIRNNENLAIESRPMVNGTDTLFFSMAAFSKKDYTMVINGSNFTTEAAFLEDRFTGNKTAINLQDTTRYTFSVTSDPLSSGNNRFMITFSKAVAPMLNTNTIVKMGPNPVTDELKLSFPNASNEKVTIKIINSLGQLVTTLDAGTDATASLNMKRFAPGTYTVQLFIGSKPMAAKKIIKE